MPRECIVHFKSMIRLGTTTRTFIDQQFDKMKELLAPDVDVKRGGLADLSTDPASLLLRDLDVGACDPAAPVTQEQIDLFQNRVGAGANDLVVYIVRSIIADGEDKLLGCATYPPGRPGVAIRRASGVEPLLAHEFGHCCTLAHDEIDDRNLMFSKTWRIPAPELSASQRSTIRSSVL